MIDENKMRAEIERARKLRSWDVRARMLVDAAVNEALARHDDDRDRHFAHDVASNAAAVLLRMIFDEDAEIARLRYEVEVQAFHESLPGQLKGIAEEALRCCTPRVIIQKEGDQ